MSHTHTPWTSKKAASSAGSLPSDRIRSSSSHSPAPTGKNKSSKGNSNNVGRNNEPRKSKAVRELESMTTQLKKQLDRGEKPSVDKHGGCFCQAREHSLSTYTPLCTSCGLILCALNLPQHACPSCASALLSNPSAVSSLITRLERATDEQLAKEAEQRQREEEREREKVGAFPALGGNLVSQRNSPSPSPAPTPIPAAGPHKVISLNSKTKRVVVSSYNSTPVSSRPASRGNEELLDEEIQVRVEKPLEKVSYAHAKLDSRRPWADLRQGVRSAKYIPAPKEEKENIGSEGGGGEGGGSRKSRSRKKKTQAQAN